MEFGIYLCIFVFAHMSLCIMCTGTHTGQKRVSDRLELELQEFAELVLETKSRSSARGLSQLSHLSSAINRIVKHRFRELWSSIYKFSKQYKYFLQNILLTQCGSTHLYLYTGRLRTEYKANVGYITNTLCFNRERKETELYYINQKDRLFLLSRSQSNHKSNY